MVNKTSKIYIENYNNRKTLYALLLFVSFMLALSYASVPLYKIFCKVTGYGGTTQIASNFTQTNISNLNEISVRLDSNVNPKLNWDFKPVVSKIKLRPGEQTSVNYIAHNTSDMISTGTATFNVTPHKAGQYFMKLECFCFTDQTLRPGEKITMPVTFFLDEEIFKDKNTIDIEEIVLSYTFFPVIKK